MLDLLLGISVMSPEQFVSESKISGANSNSSLQNGEYARRNFLAQSSFAEFHAFVLVLPVAQGVHFLPYS